MAQVITFNATSERQTYWADCLMPFQSGSFAQFAEVACHEISGSLVTLTTSAKTDIVLSRLDFVILGQFHKFRFGKTKINIGSFPYRLA
jgi:hypothetical protein